MTMPKEEFYMWEALTLAREAAAAGEVPVGSVIVRDGAIIGRGRNRREEKQAVSSHAELEAMAQANAAVGSWRLEGCELYVTLEPCPMCAGAILNARITRVYYGARDSAFGACGGVTNLFMEQFPNRPALVGGILAEECQAVLADFFNGLRQKRQGEEKSGAPFASFQPYVYLPFFGQDQGCIFHYDYRNCVLFLYKYYSYQLQ